MVSPVSQLRPTPLCFSLCFLLWLSSLFILHTSSGRIFISGDQGKSFVFLCTTVLPARELCSQWVCNKHCLGRISLLHGDRCLGMWTGESTSPHITICSSLFSILDARQS